MPRVLIIDDDPKLTQLLSDYLVDFGFETHQALLPSIGKQKLKEWSPDVLIIDVMMPEQNGLELCKEIRGYTTVPIIMLTAKGETTDRIIGLEVGADDYLAKPFEPRELVARLRAVLRRSEKEQPSGHPSLPFTFHPRRQQLELDGEVVSLHYNEVKFIQLLLEKMPSVVTRDEIAQELYSRELGVFDRSVDVMVSRLRRKLKDNPRNPRIIASVRNSGYRLLEA